MDAILSSIVISLITALLPIIPEKNIWSFIFGLSVAGYIQIMFINEGLDLLGMNPEGYHPDSGQAVFNGTIWIIILVLIIILSLWKEKLWQNIICFGAVFPIGIQSVAWISLMFSASLAHILSGSDPDPTIPI